MKKIFLFIIGFIPLFSFSQEDLNEFNDLYFESMTDNINVKFEFDNDIETFEFDDGNESYSVRPNTGLRMSIAVNHRFLTLKVGFSPKFLADADSSEKGSTKVFKISTELFLGKFIQTLEYANVKGYYIDDISDFSTLEFPGNSEFIIIPNLKTTIIRANTGYNFNSDFSFKAMLNQNEIQRKSAGSFIPSLTYEYFKMSDKTDVQELESVNIILNAGYFYTPVINKKWYANLGVDIGSGIGFNKQTVEIEDEIIENRVNEFIFNLDALIGLGYSSKSFYGGLFFRGVVTTREKNSIVKFDSARGIVKVFVGYRFKSPKSVDKGFDWVEDKNPFK